MSSGTPEDYMAIQQCLFRYCHGIDRGRADIAKTGFWPDCTDHHGDYDGPIYDFIDRVVERSAVYPFSMQHQLTNIMMTFKGDRADVESYFMAQNPVKKEDGSYDLMFMGARYLDRFERRNGEWRSAKRKVVMEWAKQLDGPSWPRQAVFAKPGRGNADADYEFFKD